MSSLSATFLSMLWFLIFIWWKTSIAIIALSRIECWGTNVGWLSQIHLWMIPLSLLVRALTSNLYIMLYNAIGLQSFIVFWSILLRIKANFVKLSDMGYLLSLSQEHHWWNISGLQIDIKCWKTRIKTIWAWTFIWMHRKHGILKLLYLRWSN